jgi:hypothetical protein
VYVRHRSSGSRMRIIETFSQGNSPSTAPIPAKIRIETLLI